MNPLQETEDCRYCYGQGRYRETTATPYISCYECDGSGVINKPKPKKRKSKMNYSTASMLINENIRAIETVYEPDATDSRGKVTNNVTRTVFKTLDPTIKVGDLVVVPSHTRHKFTTVLVERVDVEVDHNDATILSWIVDKVVLEGYKTVIDQEAIWIEDFKKAEKRRQKEDLKSKMFECYKEAGNTSMALLTGTVDHVDVNIAPAGNDTTVTSN